PTRGSPLTTRTHWRQLGARLRNLERLAPLVEFDELILPGIGPKAAERAEKAAVDVAPLQAIELTDQRHGHGMVDALEKASDGSRGCRRGPRQGGPERRAV